MTGSSQLQKQAVMSIIALEQRRYTTGMADIGHPVLTVRTLQNYTRIENVYEVQKKTFVFYYVAVTCRTTREQITYQLA